MIKILYLVLLILTIHSTVYGQYPTNLKHGLYSSLENVRNNKPQYEKKLVLCHRTITDIQLWGGNDYEVNYDSTAFSKSIVNNSYAIFDGDSLFINGKFINGSKPYCKVENRGRFLIISAGIPAMSKKKSVGYKSKMTKINPSVIGGAIGGAATGAQLAMVRFYYILDSKNGDVKILTRDFLNNILVGYPEIKSEFDADYKSDNPKDLLNYIHKINAK